MIIGNSNRKWIDIRDYSRDDIISTDMAKIYDSFAHRNFLQPGSTKIGELK